MADCNYTCYGGCKGCGSGCASGCEGGCKGCGSGCSGTCSGGCKGDCEGGCNTGCYSGCKGNCVKDCSESCRDTCKGKCKGYCAEYCQTFCQKEQTFSKNISPIKNPSNDKGSFDWTNSVIQNATIKILHSDWNTLREYIQEAVDFCGGTKPSLKDVAKDDPITADQYNDLANGIDLTNVTAKETLISADIINDLKTTYNNREIINTLPAGEYDNAAGPDECCQSKETCMASGQYLEHQSLTECLDGQTSPS